MSPEEAKDQGNVLEAGTITKGADVSRGASKDQPSLSKPTANDPPADGYIVTTDSGAVGRSA